MTSTVAPCVRWMFLGGMLLLCLPLGTAQGDAITADGRVYRGVYVREAADHYYICSPRDGRVVPVTKADVAAGSFQRSEDRDALRAQWLDKRRGAAETPAVVPEEPREDTAPDREIVRGEDGVTSIVLKGTQKPDPARETARLHYILQLRQQQALLRAEQQRLWEEEQARLQEEQVRREEEAYRAYQRDLELSEQEMRLQGIALENDYLRHRTAADARLYLTPWGSRQLGRALRDRLREAEEDTGDEAEGKASDDGEATE